MSSVIEKILEILQARAEQTVDLWDTVISDKTTFYKKRRRYLKYGTKHFKADWARWYRQRQSFYSLLSKLKREGLISKEDQSKKSPWCITAEGSKKLIKIKRKNNYPVKNQTTIKIVTFDIPERERPKRDKLRRELINLGFNKLQKSVWMSKFDVPEEFFKDLKDMELLDHVHIFSIDKSGSIIEEATKAN